MHMIRVPDVLPMPSLRVRQVRIMLGQPELLLVVLLVQRWLPVQVDLGNCHEQVRAPEEMHSPYADHCKHEKTEDGLGEEARVPRLVVPAAEACALAAMSMTVGGGCWEDVVHAAAGRRA